jgi:hypothetical protein
MKCDMIEAITVSVTTDDEYEVHDEVMGYM